MSPCNVELQWVFHCVIGWVRNVNKQKAAVTVYLFLDLKKRTGTENIVRGCSLLVRTSTERRELMDISQEN